MILTTPLEFDAGYKLVPTQGESMGGDHGYIHLQRERELLPNPGIDGKNIHSNSLCTDNAHRHKATTKAH